MRREQTAHSIMARCRTALTFDFTMMDLLPNSAFPRRWWHWLVIILAAELLWFCFMYPLVPRTAPAAAFEALLPLPLLGYIYVAVQCLLWISRRHWSRWMRQLLTAAIAVSVGAAGIWIIDWAVIHTSAEFGYQSIRGL
jgi:hypothetical protein